MMYAMTLRLLLLITTISCSWASPNFYREDYFNQKVGGVPFTVTSVSVGPHSDLENNSPATIYDRNIDLFVSAMPSEVEANHVVVFPEYALTSLGVADDRDLASSFAQVVPSRGQGINPCRTYGNGPTEDALRRLSCLASTSKVYLVVNLIEREECQTTVCRPDGLNLYNTNVVFDRNGVVIERYRKQNLYGETALDKPGSTSGFFFTDFDVSFGLATSFDLLTFDAVELTQLLNFTEVIVPFAWAGELPFLTPFQIQNGWHEANGVNILAACYDKPSQGFSGCGVYFYNSLNVRSLTYIDFVGSTSQTLQVNSLIKPEKKEEEKQEKQLKEIVYKNEDLIDYVSVPLINTTTLTEILACHNTLCCKISYQLENVASEFHYQFLVFDGLKYHSNGKVAWANQVCGLVACSGDDKLSCGDPPELSTYSNTTTFNSLEVSGVFNTTLMFNSYNSSLVMPSTMYNNYFPNENNLFDIQELNETHFLSTLTAKNVTKAVHTFGLQSYDLKMVKIENGDSMAVSSRPCMLVLVGTVVLSLFRI